MKKRYALLSGATYYPSPGWCGFSSWHDSIEDAEQKGKQEAADQFGWFQILDTETFEIVGGAGSGHTGLFGMVNAA